MYSVEINIPSSGYSNSGATITCTDTAYGEPCTSAIQTAFNNAVWSHTADTRGQVYGAGQPTSNFPPLDGQLKYTVPYAVGTGSDLSFTIVGSIPGLYTDGPGGSQVQGFVSDSSGNSDPTGGYWTYEFPQVAAGNYTITVAKTGVSGCQHVYTDVVVHSTSLTLWMCEQHTGGSGELQVLNGSVGAPITLSNPQGYTVTNYSPTTYPNASQVQVDITFVLPNGYAPLNSGGNGSWTNYQVINGVHYITCTQTASVSGSGSPGGGGPKEGISPDPGPEE